MDKSENNRLDHNSKIKNKVKTQNKGKSKKKQEEAEENNPHQHATLLNGEVSIIQNQKNQNLPLQDSSSYNQMQKQNMIDSQSYPNPVIMINPGVESPPASDIIINQQNDSKIHFSSKSQKIICPYCHKKVKTDIEEEFSCLSCIVYSLSFLFPPLFMYFMLCGNIEECICKFSCEETSCRICDSECGCCYYLKCCSCIDDQSSHCCFCDIEHYCSNCGKLIGRRNSLHLCPPCCNCCC